MDTQLASIDCAALKKGDRIEGAVVWNFFSILKRSTVELWLTEYGSEELAKAARLPGVLVNIRDWIVRRRASLELPPLVLHTKGGRINVLTDQEASEYLSARAFAGLRQHAKHTDLLIKAVDQNQLSSAAQREHENRINVHSFILASSHGAQAQLRKLRQAGKQAPRLT